MGKTDKNMGQEKSEAIWYHGGTAMQGRSHVKSGTPCQDQIQHLHKNGVSVIALADGAGSCSQSETGARVMVQRICEELADNFERYLDGEAEDVRRSLVNRIQKSLSKTAWEMNCYAMDLSSTLLAAAVSGDRFFAVHIGDGVIGCMRDGELEALSEPMNGEFKNQTYFTTFPDLRRVLRIYRGNLDGRTGFVLMSDGPSGCFYNERTGTFSRAAFSILQYLSTYREDFAQQELEKCFRNVILPRTTDDCSLICLVSSENWKGLRRMEKPEKKEIFGDRGRDLKTGRRLVETLSTEHFSSLSRLADKAHVREERMKEFLEMLQKQNLVEEKDGWYRLLVHP